MGVLGEFLIITAIAFAGVGVASIPGFPFPGSVTGMLILFILLVSGVVKFERIRRVSSFFLDILPFFFIPLVVNLVGEKEIIVEYGFSLIVVILAATLITLTVTALTATLLLKVTGKHSG